MVNVVEHFYKVYKQKYILKLLKFYNELPF